ncbi:DUF3916 domain-containing protein [Paraburkholderia aspalathi]|uniref:DUF3916 domain-containing protein n=1 Tax=Paraburkholderia aspalathi TaxID=1324617 RepID=UPI0038BBABB0
MPEKKLRGIPRRLRAIRRWPEKLSTCFPADVWNSKELYWNWKIPVNSGLVQGRYATPATRRACAQGLIDASASLLASKPAGSRSARVTCAICLPDMFASEVCVFLDEGYFVAHVDEGANIFGEKISYGTANYPVNGRCACHLACSNWVSQSSALTTMVIRSCMNVGTLVK